MEQLIETGIRSLVLRFLKDSDAEELLLRIDQSREHLRQWLSWLDGTKDVSDTLNFIRRCSASASDGTAFHYALLWEDEIVGLVSFNSVEENNHCATIGYWLAKSRTGRGLMTAAMKALISQGFRRLGLNRIQARVAIDNHESQAICDRLGLKKEGVLRQAEWLYDHYE
jgi:ribosomal-protein-serine acetyltransferase